MTRYAHPTIMLHSDSGDIYNARLVFTCGEIFFIEGRIEVEIRLNDEIQGRGVGNSFYQAYENAADSLSRTYKNLIGEFGLTSDMKMVDDLMAIEDTVARQCGYKR